MTALPPRLPGKLVLHLPVDNRSWPRVPDSLIAFHDLDRQLEIHQPSLKKGKRQQVRCVDIMGAVAGVGPYVELEERAASELRSGPRSIFSSR